MVCLSPLSSAGLHTPADGLSSSQGCGASSPMDEDAGAKQRSDSLDRQLKEDARLARNEVKVRRRPRAPSGICARI